jgi:hypothetical protein
MRGWVSPGAVLDAVVKRYLDDIPCLVINTSKML